MKHNRTPMLGFAHFYVVLSFLVSLTASQVLAQTITVTSGGNSGAGTLRDALTQAAYGYYDHIVISTSVPTITISSTLIYNDVSGYQSNSVRVDGNYHTLIKTSGSSSFRLLDATTKNGLEFYGIEFKGGRGARITVASTASGNKTINLYDVIARDSGSSSALFQGILVEDTSSGDLNVNSPYSLYTNNSTEGLRVNKSGGNLNFYAYDTDFTSNGYAVNSGGEEHDGIQLEQTGTGNLVATFTHCKVLNNGEDGLDIDETGNGNVTIRIDGSQSQYDGNGKHGAAVNETGSGSISGTTIRDASFHDNDRDGWHTKVGNSGSVTLTFNNCDLDYNDDGFQLEDDGGYTGTSGLSFSGCKVENNADDGIVSDGPSGYIGMSGTLNDYRPNGDDDLNLAGGRLSWSTSGFVLNTGLSGAF